MISRAALALALMTSGLACLPASKANNGGGTGGSGAVACSTDGQCANGGCVQGKCISRASIPATWAAEVRPTDPTAPTTEQTVLTTDTASGFLKLKADPTI